MGIRMKQKMKALMSRLMVPTVMQRVGLSLVCAGALLLVASYMLNCTNVNALLLLCLVMIAVGIIIYVLALKRESVY